MVIGRVAGGRLLLSALIAVSLSLSAHAQSPVRETTARNAQEARRLYQSGERAFQENRFEAALRYFEQAYQIAPRPELLYNIGRAAENAQNNERAIEAYGRYLAETEAAHDGSADTRHAEVAGRLAVLQAPPAVATTPTATAAATPENERVLVATAPAASDSHSVTDEGWFWPVVLGGAALVAGGVVLAVVLSSSGSRVPTGDDGVSAEALRFAPMIRF